MRNMLRAPYLTTQEVYFRSWPCCHNQIHYSHWGSSVSRASNSDIGSQD